MRVAIGLIALGLVGGVVPTGLPGISHAVQVLAGTACALLSLVLFCLAGAVASRSASSFATSAPRLSVASAVWANRPGWPQANGFTDVDVVREPVALAGAPASALGRRLKTSSETRC
jgi:hypothetical protein